MITGGVGDAAGSSVVSLNGAKVEAWAFSPNNVLSWEDGAGHTAWLLFMSLAGGPVIMGNVLKPDQAPPSGECLGFKASPFSAQ